MCQPDKRSSIGLIHLIDNIIFNEETNGLSYFWNA